MNSWVLCNLILFAAAWQVAPDRDLLPPDGFLQAWNRSEKARVFTSSDLYGHIDGGAEIFLEFGFEQLTVQSYAATKGRPGEIQVEIYRMKDALAAAGIYLASCGRESPDPSFPERHTLNDYQLIFKRNRQYVIVNNLEGDKGLRAAMLAFARHIAERLPPEVPIGLDESLPRAGLDRSSIRLIRGPYALQAVYTLGEGDILQLGGRVTAVSGTYRGAQGKYALIVADYPDDAAARRAFEHVRRNLDPYLTVVEAGAMHVRFKDHAGGLGEISLQGRRLTIRTPQS